MTGAPVRAEGRGASGMAVAAGALNAMVWSLVLLALLFVVPRFREIFADFGVNLPVPASAAIRLSELMWDVPLWPAAVVVIGIMAAVGVAGRKRGGVVAGVLTVLLVIGVIATLALVAGLFVPLTRMIGSLEGS